MIDPARAIALGTAVDHHALVNVEKESMVRFQRVMRMAL